MGGGCSKSGQIAVTEVNSSNDGRPISAAASPTLEENCRLFKLTVLGDEQVGKSCICSRLADDYYSSSYIPTIGVDFKVKMLTVAKQNVKLQIWDTSGNNRFLSIIRSYLRGANGFLIVCDLTRPNSFQNIEKWKNMLEMEFGGEKKPIIVAGNKCDLSEEQAITSDDALSICEKQDCKYQEVSAKENINIDKLFTELTVMMLDK